MNRQQRRSRPHLSRAEWSLRINELRKSMPKQLPGDVDIVQMLMDIIVAEQTQLADESLAVLCGLACALTERAMQSLPKPTHVDKDGTPVYSAAQIAAWTGQSHEETLRGLSEFAKQTGATYAGDDDVQPLH
jgi:hypothetical protein